MLSHVQLLRPHGQRSLTDYSSWDSPGKNIGVDCHFLLQGIFLTQELNPDILHCRQILDQLSYKGSFACNNRQIGSYDSGSAEVKSPDTSVSLQRSGSLVLSRLQILTRQTHSGTDFSFSTKRIWLTGVSLEELSLTLVSTVSLLSPRSALDSCCFDKMLPSFFKAWR